MSLLTRPTSRLPTYAEAVSTQAYVHEPFFVLLTPVHGDPENSRRRDPPVHDIGAGDRLVALIDINVRKVVRALLPKSRTVEMRARSGASTESALLPA